MKLNSFSKNQRKPWIRQRKTQPKPAKKTVQAAVVEADEDVQPNFDADPSQLNNPPNSSITAQQAKPETSTFQITTSGPQNVCDTASLYDWKTFYEQVIRTSSVNYAGNKNLNWGVINLNF